jgi:hypothetical protein
MVHCAFVSAGTLAGEVQPWCEVRRRWGRDAVEIQARSMPGAANHPIRKPVVSGCPFTAARNIGSVRFFPPVPVSLRRGLAQCCMDSGNVRRAIQPAHPRAGQVRAA